MAADPIDVVRRFCDSWAAGDLDATMAFFADGAVYHNIPLAPVEGTDAIRATIEGFTTGVDSMEFHVLHIAAAGDVVLTERIDVFHRAGGEIRLPVAGTFELEDSKIRAWRDYFDLNQFMAQLPEA